VRRKAGGESSGKRDQNLLVYITGIAYECMDVILITSRPGPDFG
jgi:hypothetical protein